MPCGFADAARQALGALKVRGNKGATVIFDGMSRWAKRQAISGMRDDIRVLEMGYGNAWEQARDRRSAIAIRAAIELLEAR